ncbi:MAG: 1,2-phenylacetyl-CoA epoxidase subunit PaaC [Chitinophagaceae bacterium]
MNSQLIDYTLHLADTTLILSQRNAEWCGHGPILEQDIAITNISLDLLGQSRNLYQYAAVLINESLKSQSSKAPPRPNGLAGRASEGFGEASEDSLAYLRKEREYKNLLLVEQANGDWGQTILRQYLFSQFQYLLFEQLQNSNDEQLAAIAAKSIKETTYHVRWSSEWVIRLGDGTEESRNRMLNAIDELWSYTGEMFIPAVYEEEMNIDFNKIKNEWENKVSLIFNEASLIPPSGGGGAAFMQSGGKEGKHTEQLGFILTELQYMQRAYPGAKW